jgi:tetratricopeptide (TPR) repeat protein
MANLNDRAGSLRAHESAQFLAKHGGAAANSRAAHDFARARSDIAVRRHSSGDWHGGGWHDGHHFGHHRFRDSFFFASLGFPFYGHGFYDPWWYPWYPWGFYPSYAYYSGWPYYDYDPYYEYPLSEGTYTSPAYAGSSYFGPTADAAPVIDAPPPVGSAPVAQLSEPISNASESNEFAGEGEAAFKGRDYKAAVHAWRHAVLDNPKNGTLVMMLAQALFASGEFVEAAGATQQAMSLLPDDKWGVVVGNYRELYSDTQDYVDQLKALEKAVKDQPKNPALRFLIGFHYGHLGYPVEATRELDELLKLAPQDQLGHKLRDAMAEKAGQKPAAPTTAPEAKKPSETE